MANPESNTAITAITAITAVTAVTAVTRYLRVEGRVANPESKDDGKEELHLVGHRDEHQKVARHHLRYKPLQTVTYRYIPLHQKVARHHLRRRATRSLERDQLVVMTVTTVTTRGYDGYDGYEKTRTCAVKKAPISRRHLASLWRSALTRLSVLWLIERRRKVSSSVERPKKKVPITACAV